MAKRSRDCEVVLGLSPRSTRSTEAWVEEHHAWKSFCDPQTNLWERAKSELLEGRRGGCANDYSGGTWGKGGAAG
eukprot:2922838-Alexandrium_andersonii.AAC.1